MSQPTVNKEQLQKAAEMEKEGAERLMAFSVGVDNFCNENGITYGQFAKVAGVEPEQLTPGLVELLVRVVDQQAA